MRAEKPVVGHFGENGKFRGCANQERSDSLILMDLLPCSTNKQLKSRHHVCTDALVVWRQKQPTGSDFSPTMNGFSRS